MTGHARPLAISSLAVAATLLAACTSSRPAPIHHDPAVPALRLVAFDDCADLLQGLRAAARESVGPYGLPSDPGIVFPATGGVAEDAAGGSRALSKNSPTAPGPSTPQEPDHSGTNTQEAGVDEPDLVKTDGRRVVTVTRATLRVVDTASRTVTGTLSLGVDGGQANLLVAGDHALVVSAGPTTGTDTDPNGAPQFGTDTDRNGAPQFVKPETTDPWRVAVPATRLTRLTLVDLTGPPRVLARYTIDGSFVDARQVGGTVRVAVRSSPRLPFRLDGEGSDGQRIADNRRVIDAAPLRQWLPSYTVDVAGRQTTGRVDCHAVSRPDTYSGASLLTLLSFDLANSTLGNGDPTSLVADGDTVYATATSMYVASDNRWRPPVTPGGRAESAMDQQTTVYKFDIAGTARPRFVAGGKVPGWLLNRYAMSEWGGKLRVASTNGQSRLGQTTMTESSVYILDGALRQVGHVGGLGRGERVYAVRFVGPTGYVVTFRQTDPLYVVDLREPTAPRLTGELTINGYSSYLHPAGDGRLIGVGQDGTDGGSATGLQVSLFDVGDPAHPSRISRYALPGGYSRAESDPHAFLYWPATGTVVVPIWSPTGNEATGGAVTLRLSGTTINAAGTVSAPRGEQILRTLMIGNTLWAVTDTKVAAFDAGTLTQLAEL
ncbi:MAG: hypothetical protein QOE03_1114 [Micromonosporaceae bacterium]|nr:hypothetical protein [Micromonosporaceae bacterium]